MNVNDIIARHLSSPENQERRCEVCGKMFRPSKPHFRTCYECSRTRSGPPGSSGPQSMPQDMLLKDYFDENGQYIKEVYVGVPERVAQHLAAAGLTNKQLRAVHSSLTRIRDKAQLQGLDVARPLIWKLRADVAYQLKRDVVKDSFASFINHHCSLAERSIRHIKGFWEHLDSVVCYFKDKSEGGKR